MKTYCILITLAFLVSLWWNYDNLTTAEASSKALRKEIRHHQHRADSLESYALATKDSLDVAFTTIKYLNVATEEAKEKLRKREANEKIIYVRFDNDTLRNSALSELYPSFRNR